ncbi:MAG: acetylxylan esterase [Verrucomicrobia bacterium]|nr:acetylxylan esterase [Verrucomicrobiota bacterium]MBI3867647.1 acetylxylan esterase [Verrucomicrobiota bacterium]
MNTDPLRSHRFFTAVASSVSRALSSALVGCALGLLLCAGEGSSLALPRVLPNDQRPTDHRLAPPKDLDGYFPFTPPESVSAWEQRSQQVRRQILVSLGLWPMPTRSPMNPVIHGRIDREDYTVERVYFESMPGFFVTGNLYRPKGRAGKLPGVLCPHGHWQDGRFYDNKNVRQEIERGAERFEEGGRSVLQARCVQLARMGCVVFHYDMLGNADSQQLSLEIVHGFSKQRPEMIGAKNWGLYSPQAESQAQNIMGLQTYNSIRSLDFLLGLEDVDASRIGVTGASGGGTQTFMLCAVDPRPTVAFPAVMVCTAMQGGCTCENASGLRIDTGNVEFAGLFAPKPLGMTGADDWTKEMSTKGYPELRQLYTTLGHPENVHFRALNQFGHNYNSPSREVMYAWMNKHLKLGAAEPVVERDYRRLSTAEMTVWDKGHPAPEGGAAFERRLLRWWHEDAQQQMTSAQVSLPRYQEVYGDAIRAIVGRGLPEAGEVTYDQTVKQETDKYWVMGGVLEEKKRREQTPVLFFHPKQWNGRVIVWAHAQGKAGVCDASDANAFRPNAEVERLLGEGTAVAAMDVVHQGEFLEDPSKPLAQTPRVRNNRESAAYTLGYNPSVFAQRVHDILRVVSFVRHHERQPKSVALIGLAGAGHWAAAARAVAGTAVSHAIIDTRGFRFIDVGDIRHPDLLPGGAKYGDLPGMLALSAPGKLWLAGENDSGKAFVTKIYKAASASERLKIEDALDLSKALAWLGSQD